LDRQDFGALIAELRQEHSTLNKTWTREMLGEKSGLGKNIVDNIEQGKKAHIEPETLQALCDALELSLLERKELFLAASGIDAVKAPNVNSLDYLQAQEEIVEKSQSPCFIMSPYGDILGLNPIILKFYQITKKQLDESSLLSRYNIMRLLFSPEFSMQRNLMGQSWAPFAHRTIQTFRARSLRYRARPRFKELIAEMTDAYPLFASYWQGAPLMKQDYNPVLDNSRFSYALLGFKFEVATTTIVSVTPHGELILYSFLPLSPEASWAFQKLFKIAGTGIIRLASWP
jgi:DNA-binding Xre family transcriptional regulator